jgi:hypothetical protein
MDAKSEHGMNHRDLLRPSIDALWIRHRRFESYRPSQFSQFDSSTSPILILACQWLFDGNPEEHPATRLVSGCSRPSPGNGNAGIRQRNSVRRLLRHHAVAGGDRTARLGLATPRVDWTISRPVDQAGWTFRAVCLDDVESGIEVCPTDRLIADPIPGCLEARPPELVDDQFDVGRPILQDQAPNRAGPPAQAAFSTAGLLSRSQYMPSSRTASVNCSNSTGLTM